MGISIILYLISSSRLACCFLVEKWMDEMKIIIGQNNDVVVG